MENIIDLLKIPNIVDDLKALAEYNNIQIIIKPDVSRLRLTIFCPQEDIEILKEILNNGRLDCSICFDIETIIPEVREEL